MDDRISTPESGSVDDAINHVLAAERDARQVVDECRAEGARILAAAEERARSISQRTEKRIKAAHLIADRQVARALAELRGGPSLSTDNGKAVPESERLLGAVDALVDEIIGTGP